MMQANFLWDGSDCDPPADVKWELIRRYRNELLARCDWTQLPDASLTLDEKQAWAAYRQELRDIPDNFLLPLEVVFPNEPQPFEPGAE